MFVNLLNLNTVYLYQCWPFFFCNTKVSFFLVFLVYNKENKCKSREESHELCYCMKREDWIDFCSCLVFIFTTLLRYLLLRSVYHTVAFSMIIQVQLNLSFLSGQNIVDHKIHVKFMFDDFHFANTERGHTLFIKCLTSYHNDIDMYRLEKFFYTFFYSFTIHS